ncbi:MAG: hypothetical protein SPL37_06555 [Prevotella sp.]|nr:hypothetical protein [Prevotella sp.]
MKKITFYLFLIIAGIILNLSLGSYSPSNVRNTNNINWDDTAWVDTSYQIDPEDSLASYNDFDSVAIDTCVLIDSLDTIADYDEFDADSTADDFKYPISTDSGNISYTVRMEDLRGHDEVAGIYVDDNYTRVKIKTSNKFGHPYAINRNCIAFKDITYGGMNWGALNYQFVYDSDGKSYCKAINFIKPFLNLESAKKERERIKKYLNKFFWESYIDDDGLKYYLSGNSFFTNGFDDMTIAIQKEDNIFIVMLSYERDWNIENF